MKVYENCNAGCCPGESRTSVCVIEWCHHYFISQLLGTGQTGENGLCAL